MRQWLRDFFFSGQFLIWLGAISLLLSYMLPVEIGNFLFATLVLLSIGALIGWVIARFLRYSLIWGMRRALIDFATLPLIIITVFFVAWFFSALVALVFGNGDAIAIARDDFDELAEFAAIVLLHPVFLSGFAIGCLTPMFRAYRRGRFERSSDFLSAKQQLKQFLNYYLKAWRLRSAKELPFQHDWSANPEDVGNPREDEVKPYLDLLTYRWKWWRRVQTLFRRRKA